MTYLLPDPGRQAGSGRDAARLHGVGTSRAHQPTGTARPARAGSADRCALPLDLPDSLSRSPGRFPLIKRIGVDEYLDDHLRVGARCLGLGWRRNLLLG